MAEQEHQVKIVTWPEEAAKLEHSFDLDKPCPVSISFEDKPANVSIQTTPKQPLHVDMAMNVVAKDTIPVCIKLCEPICAKSDYTIGITIFDRPVSAITIGGLTRLFNCREKEPAELICFDFRKLKPGMVFKEPFPYEGIKFSPLGDQIETSTIGDPPDQVKLAIPPDGIRIDFPQPVSNIILTVNNYAGPTLDFLVYAGNTLITQFAEQIENEVKEVTIAHSEVTAVEIKGGGNEASIVKLCYLPDQYQR